MMKRIRPQKLGWAFPSPAPNSEVIQASPHRQQPQPSALFRSMFHTICRLTYFITLSREPPIQSKENILSQRIHFLASNDLITIDSGSNNRQNIESIEGSRSDSVENIATNNVQQHFTAVLLWSLFLRVGHLLDSIVLLSSSTCCRTKPVFKSFLETFLWICSTTRKAKQSRPGRTNNASINRRQAIACSSDRSWNVCPHNPLASLVVFQLFISLISTSPLYVHSSQDVSTFEMPNNRSMASFGFEPLSNVTLSDNEPVGRRISLPAPVNISVILISWFPPAVRVNWAQARSQIRNTRMQAFQIIYHPVQSRYRIIQEVPPFYTNLTLDRLQPGIEYSLRINSLSESGATNTSRLVCFISPDSESRRAHRKFINRPIHTYPDELQEGLQVREDEVVIVVLVLCAWIGCIFIFFNKWGKIRMLEPYQPQYKESFHASVHSIHPKPSRMNTCTSVPPNMISIESRGSLIGNGNEREFVLLHNSRVNESGNLYQCASGTTYHHPAYRPRLNSVFVGNPYHRDSLYPENSSFPKKAKSAEDLKSLLVVQVNQHAIHDVPSTSTSVL